MLGRSPDQKAEDDELMISDDDSVARGTNTPSALLTEKVSGMFIKF